MVDCMRIGLAQPVCRQRFCRHPKPRCTTSALWRRCDALAVTVACYSCNLSARHCVTGAYGMSACYRSQTRCCSCGSRQQAHKCPEAYMLTQFHVHGIMGEPRAGQRAVLSPSTCGILCIVRTFPIIQSKADAPVIQTLQQIRVAEVLLCKRHCACTYPQAWPSMHASKCLQHPVLTCTSLLSRCRLISSRIFLKIVLS
jgi:hypothetical protein